MLIFLGVENKAEKKELKMRLNKLLSEYEEAILSHINYSGRNPENVDGLDTFWRVFASELDKEKRE